MPSDNDLLSLLPIELQSRVQTLRASEGVATLVLDGSGLDASGRAALQDACRQALTAAPHVSEVRVAVMGEKLRRRVVAIASGKGGVGKSTLTANLAVALHAMGHKVGVVDADVYGPSQPRLLASEGAKPQAKDKQLIPVRGHGGIPMLSMGHLVDADKALAWRGPMAAGALTQLMEADWGSAELLLMDLPPGTGDVQITMVQKFRPDGAVVVSTPQDLALIDARRAMQLFAQVDVPIIGMVENMSGYICPHCGETSDPFGTGGVAAEAEKLGLPLLGQIPLAPSIRQASDAGQPVADGGEMADHYVSIAKQLADWLAKDPA